MDYYGNNDWRDYLAHYGVKGMKWRNHKYIEKLGNFYRYRLTGQGYLKDADKHSKQARILNSYAKKTGGMNSEKGRTYYKKALDAHGKASKSYYNYKTKSLGGKVSKNMPSAYSGPNNYDPYSRKNENLSGKKKAQRKAKYETVKTHIKTKAAKASSKGKRSFSKAKKRVSKFLSRIGK